MAAQTPRLVAVGFDESAGDGGAAAVWTSLDGLVWKRVPHDEAVFGGLRTQGMTSVAAGGPGLVAVGRDEGAGDEGAAAVWTSSDGLAWSRVFHREAVFGGPGSQRMLGVAAGGPGLVAVGFDDRAGIGRGAAVWTSRDGFSWRRVPHREAVFGGRSDQLMWGVAAGGPGLVAVGADGGRRGGAAAVWTSGDGLSWSRVPHNEAIFGGALPLRMIGVTAGGPGVVAVGDTHGDGGSAVWISTDGLSWSRVPDNEEFSGRDVPRWMVSVVAAGPGLVGVGGNGKGAVVWTSRDGLTWNRLRHKEAVFGGPGVQTMAAVAVGGPGLVAVGIELYPNSDNNAAVWTSHDGLSWRRVSHNEAVFGGPRAQHMHSVARVEAALDAASATTGSVFAAAATVVDSASSTLRCKNSFLGVRLPGWNEKCLKERFYEERYFCLKRSEVDDSLLLQYVKNNEERIATLLLQIEYGWDIRDLIAPGPALRPSSADRYLLKRLEGGGGILEWLALIGEVLSTLDATSTSVLSATTGTLSTIADGIAAYKRAAGLFDAATARGPLWDYIQQRWSVTAGTVREGASPSEAWTEIMGVYEPLLTLVSTLKRLSLGQLAVWFENAALAYRAVAYPDSKAIRRAQGRAIAKHAGALLR